MHHLAARPMAISVQYYELLMRRKKKCFKRTPTTFRYSDIVQKCEVLFARICSQTMRSVTFSAIMLACLVCTASCVQNLDQAKIHESVALLTPPDPCLLNTLATPVNPISPPNPGDGIDIYVPPNLAIVNTKAVALIVNGQGFNRVDYQDFATFLARNGFITVVAERKGFNTSVEEFVLDALAETFSELELAAETPIALVGHSWGGQVVVNATKHNHDVGHGFDIRAVVSLAPKIADIQHIDGLQTSAYLLIYGSQDEDVAGATGNPREAFSAYDLSGTENSTTCSQPLCVNSKPSFERIMIYVHGAGHAALVNQLPQCVVGQTCEETTPYLDKLDQFCVAKGYTNAFLRWKLRDEAIFKRVLRNRHLPPSIQAIKTSKPDIKGNGIGSPLRLFFQFSPDKRIEIENFEDGNFSLWTRSQSVFVELSKNEYSTGPSYVRHRTRYLLSGWLQSEERQWLGFNVPAQARNTSAFSHFAMRVGQFSGSPQAFENPKNKDQSIGICLSDGIRGHCVGSQSYGAIPPNDPQQPDGVAHSVMNTIAVPLEEFLGLDRQNIEAIVLLFPPKSQGTLMVDSLEWFKKGSF